MSTLKRPEYLKSDLGLVRAARQYVLGVEGNPYIDRADLAVVCARLLAWEIRLQKAIDSPEE